MVPAFRFLCISVLFSCFFSCKNNDVAEYHKPFSNDSLPAMLISGLGDTEWESILNSTAGKYGFRFLHVGGCVISKRLADSMQSHNDLLYQQLELKYGKGFRSNFFEKTELLYDLQRRVSAFMNNDTAIVRRNSEMGRSAYETTYEIEPDIKGSIVTVRAYGYTLEKGRLLKIVYYTIYLDIVNDDCFLLYQF